ncbi:MAG: hypothetical protein WD075_07060 [Rhodospirillales bacterium]
MSNDDQNNNRPDPDSGARMIEALGMEGFVEHMDTLQTSLQKVADGMELLSGSAVRQGQDTDNLAAHILAVESLLTVMLRQMPVDIAEVRREALRRSESAGEERSRGHSMVADICEDILRRADD